MHSPCVATKPTARDSLATLLARGRISEAQFRAGQEFRRCYQIADKRRLDQPGLGSDQRTAWEALARSYKALGLDGSSIATAALIDGLGAKEIAAARGQIGPQWEKFYRMRLKECLACLAETLGFAGEQKRVRASGSKPQNIGAQ